MIQGWRGWKRIDSELLRDCGAAESTVGHGEGVEVVAGWENSVEEWSTSPSEEDSQFIQAVNAMIAQLKHGGVEGRERSYVVARDGLLGRKTSLQYELPQEGVFSTAIFFFS